MRDTTFHLGFILELALTIWAAYAAWGNIVEKRITRIGFDGFMLGLIGLMAGKANAEQARQSPRSVRVMGIMMVLVAIGGIWNMVVFAIEHGWI